MQVQGKDMAAVDSHTPGCAGTGCCTVVQGIVLQLKDVD